MKVCLQQLQLVGGPDVQEGREAFQDGPFHVGARLVAHLALCHLHIFNLGQAKCKHCVARGVHCIAKLTLSLEHESYNGNQPTHCSLHV